MTVAKLPTAERFCGQKHQLSAQNIAEKHCWLHLKTSRSFRLSPEMPTMAPPRFEISSAAQLASLVQQEAPGCHRVHGDLLVASYACDTV